MVPIRTKMTSMMTMTRILLLHFHQLRLPTNNTTSSMGEVFLDRGIFMDNGVILDELVSIIGIMKITISVAVEVMAPPRRIQHLDGGI